ncbi:sigma-70 family rna polymerase sigma factor : RNA polymerase sigma factor, sigma-70 family OS=Singulisphaera acidiphila (strain ATCC BAA-1392 / DSM 18658 / VKM B-2454 / MOB10) GN=Sinac_7487 PE=4 SV=1: Sigma70_r2: Sigma70_r4_2 [Gemmata massiliana]|uniref:ECF RNA polymerase sigma factor SigE n=1 Tax=Gemmata massiliana TaxID=1210884 RepID=A0A6P2CUB3_9BACT|nr:sigma-70 family RNA polymerase sigma factor [Gemmata massiliana]VTR91284.1 sigma-70 family rna polymerase sigma factor : RNA polymerase sigma factor, sigma-70 family OS=Singulisphaera acidiphila (strain ATCC BAA-1392 / DSM 18658 / VKM B-2454 / MOB10) GN=Sinac_7487 PE=4 SV=1: Sigma70_r2: Sigma70_r4_2 [Gemmata massiliana]
MEAITTTSVAHKVRRTVLLQDGTGLTDGRLLDSFIEHQDGDAFATLVRRHGPMVWGVCRRLLDQHDAEDAFQATFLVLVRKAASVVPRECVGNWLYGVARQTALQGRRTSARRKGRETREADVAELPVREDADRCDLHLLLDQELSRLPDRYRTVVVMCDLEGNTRKETARQLGVPEGSVAGWLARGRATLAKRLARQGVSLPAGILATALGQAAVGRVPPSVVSSTIGAARIYTTGQVTAELISMRVIALTEGVLKAMTVSKLKLVTAVLFAAVCFVGGVAAALPPAVGQPPTAEKKVETAKSPAGETPQSKTDQEKLQGRWTVVSLELGGRVLTPDELSKENVDDVIFEGDRVKPTRADPENSLWHGKYKLDARRDPKQITVYDEEPDNTVMTFRGIYTLDGDTLKWCMNPDGTDVCRPEEFKTKKGSPLCIFTLKRVPATK